MEARLEQYRIFNTAAQTGSISEAAEKLFVTQSAVSQSIKQLEATIGTKLFIRGPRGVTLTPEGELLYQYTSAALELIESGSRRLSAIGELTEGELRIGASDTVSSYFLLPRLESFHKAYPGIKISVVNRVTTEAVELVKRGGLDLAFGNLPIDDDALEIIPCLTVHDIFVAGKGFEKYRGRVVSRREICSLPLILLEKKSNSRNYVDAEFLSSGDTLSPGIELGAHELLLQLAQIGLGVSCVIKEFSSKYLENGDVFEISLRNPLPPRAVGCLFPKKQELNPAAKKFVDIIAGER